MCGKELVSEDIKEEPILKINEDYAKKYEFRKQREELNELKNKLGSDLKDYQSSSDDEIEDENGALINPEISGKILETITMIRAKKDEIYDPKKNFFDKKQLKELKKEWKQVAKKSEKDRLTLRDYHSKKLRGELRDSSSSDNEDFNQDASLNNDEDRNLLRKTLESCEDQAQDEDLFVKKEKKESEIEKEDSEYKQFLLERMAQVMGETEFKSWRESINSKDVNPNEKFLLDYVLNRKWVDNSNANNFYELSSNYSEAEEFENRHNFRFEEPDSKQIITYSRNIENLVRKSDERRIKKRKKTKEKKKTEITKKTEEIKRFKSLKKKEILNKLKLIQKYTDIPLDKLKNINLEEDFDANSFDRQMAAMFNDDYYNSKPLPESDIDEGNTVDCNIVEGNIIDGNTVEKKRPKRSKKSKISVSQLSKYSFKKAIDELVNVDYEDVVGGQTARFKYIESVPITYNLTPEQILETDDAILNRVASIKKLAPYRDPAKVNREEKKIAKRIHYMKKRKFNGV